MAHPGYEVTWERLCQAWSDWAGPMEDVGDFEEFRAAHDAGVARDAAEKCAQIAESTGSGYHEGGRKAGREIAEQIRAAYRLEQTDD